MSERDNQPCSGPQQLERRGLYSPRPPMSASRQQWLQDRLDLLPDTLRVSREELVEAMRAYLERQERNA
jgi:uncharacterized protein YPO0396